MHKLLAEIQKTKAPGKTTVGSNPLVLPRDPAQEFLTGEDWVNIGAELSLSARELEVAVLLFEGKTRASIARRFRRSPGTVRVYIDGLFKKFRVRDRRGLMLRILRVHWAIKTKPH